jgi:signal transduction histidine kinase
MKVVVLSGEMAGTEFALREGVNRLGRRGTNDICIPLDPRISRNHAEVRLANGEWLLDDIGSVNGTFVEQRRIHAPTPIQPGEQFRIGRTWLALHPEPAQLVDGDSTPALVLVDESDVSLVGQTEGQSIVFSLEAEVPPPVSPEDVAALEGRLDVLQRIGVALGSTLDLNALLAGIMDSIFSVVPAERGYLMLIDPTTGQLVPRVTRRRTETAAGEEVMVSRHIVDKALDERVVILTADAQADERFHTVDSVKDLEIRSAICAPLVRRGASLGIIFLDSTSRTHVFTEKDVELINGIAMEAAVAIENARLYTDLRQAYDELREAQAQLVHTEKLSTMGTLSATIAHDMANIVSPLSGLVELVLAGTKLDAGGEELLRRQMQRLVALTRRLMSFSKPERIELEPTDVREQITGTLAFLRTECIHRKTEVETDLPDDLPRVMTDPLQVEGVLLNLCINALEAMGEDGGAIKVSVRQDIDEVVIDVTDSGPGIAPADQAHLFDPFFTTKEHGTGLGLYSCKRIVVEELGGSVEVDSVPGHGATFTVRLPIQTATAKESAVPRPS